jgi:hypothetical protein
LITKKGVNLSSCALAKPKQLLSIIICLSKLFLIKPEDLFVLVRFWECYQACCKHHADGDRKLVKKVPDYLLKPVLRHAEINPSNSRTHKAERKASVNENLLGATPVGIYHPKPARLVTVDDKALDHNSMKIAIFIKNITLQKTLNQVNKILTY